MEECRKLEELRFYKGEKRYVTYEVVSTKNEKVVVTDPTFILKHNDETIVEGACEIINSNEIQVLISADDVGSFDLEITYNIGAEIRKVRCKVNVN